MGLKNGTTVGYQHRFNQLFYCLLRMKTNRISRDINSSQIITDIFQVIVCLYATTA